MRKIELILVIVLVDEATLKGVLEKSVNCRPNDVKVELELGSFLQA